MQGNAIPIHADATNQTLCMHLPPSHHSDVATIALTRAPSWLVRATDVNDVFPSRIPPSAFLLALDASEPGATGKLNMVLGRYGYMTFDLWAQDIEQTTVPAGTFRTLKVIMRVDADSVMKYWPAFVRRLAQPFFPKNVLYYDTAPPHHLIKFVGSFGYLASEVTVQMTRVYIASESARDRR